MLKRMISMILAFVIMVPFLPSFAGAEELPEETPAVVTAAVTEDYSAAAEVWQLINDKRAEQDAASLSRSAVLTELAMQRAAEIALYYDAEHKRPDDTAFETIFEGCSNDWTIYQEVICLDERNTDDLLREWTRDTETNTVLMSGQFNQIGIGCSIANGDRCWVAILGYSTTDMETTDTQGTVNGYRQIRVLPSRLDLWPEGEWNTYVFRNSVIEMDIRSTNNESFSCRTRLVPTLTNAVNRKGEVIATLQMSETEHGVIEIRGVQSGIGTAVLSLYEGQPDPLTVVVTFPNEEDEHLPLVPPDPEAHDSGTWGDNLTWTLEGTTLTISGEGDMAPEVYSESSFPWTYYRDAVYHLIIEDGVTSINEYAFDYFSVLETVELPDTLRSIGYRAFLKCEELKAISLPDSATELGADIFSSCTSLESVRLPADLTAIPADLLSGTSIRQIEIPEGVTAIGTRAFSGCSNLERIEIPETVTTLGESCFRSCSSLREVVLPSGITAIPDNCFDRCSALTAIALPEGITAIGDGAFQLSGLISITVPQNVDTIGDNAFANCLSLEEIILPDEMSKLGYSCFSYCTSLKTLELPDGLDSIPQSCFWRSGLESLVIPSGVESISNYAFEECEKLTSLVIPDTVVNMVLSAVEGCPNLTIGCYTMSYSHLFALRNELAYELLPEDPTTVLYPVTVYANNGGTIALSSAYSPANRFVLVQITPDEDHQFASLFYYRTDGIDEDLLYEQLSDLEYLIFMPSCELILDVTFLLKELPFVDVPETEYYYLPVLWAVSDGITAGTDATHFTPNASCTRAQVVTFLWRTAGQPEPAITEHPFVDVKPEDYFYKAVLWALENGITAGTDASHFSPNAPCTRAQVVTFLWRACGKPEPTQTSNYFVDVMESEYYYAAVLWASEYQITSGVDSTHFFPNNTCTRGQIVTFLFRTFY